jgi:hypothetical protein
VAFEDGRVRCARRGPRPGWSHRSTRKPAWCRPVTTPPTTPRRCGLRDGRVRCHRRGPTPGWSHRSTRKPAGCHRVTTPPTTPRRCGLEDGRVRCHPRDPTPGWCGQTRTRQVACHQDPRRGPTPWRSAPPRPPTPCWIGYPTRECSNRTRLPRHDLPWAPRRRRSLHQEEGRGMYRFGEGHVLRADVPGCPSVRRPWRWWSDGSTQPQRCRVGRPPWP